VLTFSVTATGATQYQWYVWGGTSWDALSDDATYDGVSTATLEVTINGSGDQIGEQYYCEVGSSATCLLNSNVVYIINSCSFALPVEWLSFSGKAQEGYRAVLAWQTATEINSEGFVIEKSLDGKRFEDIGFVAGQGDSKVITSYTFTDSRFYQSAYYRLRQTDVDGAFEYSDLIFIEVPIESRLQLYPNPFQHMVELNLPDHVELHASTYSINGQLVLQDNCKVVELEAQLTALPAGLYILKLSGKDVTGEIRFRKQ
jgi:hypothetical protein